MGKEVCLKESNGDGNREGQVGGVGRWEKIWVELSIRVKGQSSVDIGCPPGMGQPWASQTPPASILPVATQRHYTWALADFCTLTTTVRTTHGCMQEARGGGKMQLQ